MAKDAVQTTALAIPEDRMPGEEDIESPAERDPNEKQQRQDEGPRLELQRTISGPPYSIFTPRAKMFIVVAVSISSLISPFGATTFYPALDVIAKDLGVTPTLINLSLTTYMVSKEEQSDHSRTNGSA